MKHKTAERPAVFFRQEISEEVFRSMFPPMPARHVTVSPKPLGPGYRGRRARRQAFAHRQRFSRLLNRIYRTALPEHESQMVQVADALVRTGTAWVHLDGTVSDGRDTFYDDGLMWPPA